MRLLAWVLSLLAAAPATAYQLSGSRWPQPQTTFRYDLVNTRGERSAASGTAWNDAFQTALQRWNDHTGFRFLGDPGQAGDPCRDDGVNTAGFRRDDCGFAFGRTTLAITYSVFRGGILQETDIVFNDNESWDIYEGPLRSKTTDFTRVAVHELGHALGLGHEDTLPSIMTSQVNDLTLPQKDDLDGVATLYGSGGSTTPCQEADLPLNTPLSGRLEASDCRRLDVASDAFDSDDSAVDLYRLELPLGGIVLLFLDSETIDPYLELRSADGKTLLAMDDDSGRGTSALIQIRLDPGSYQVLANSALPFLQEGDYRLRAVIGTEGNFTATLETDGSLTLSLVAVNDTFYWARLIPYADPLDPGGSYWRLEDFGPAAVTQEFPGPAATATLLPDGGLVLNPVAVSGDHYDAVLRRHLNLREPSARIWKLESAEKRRQGGAGLGLPLQ